MYLRIADLSIHLQSHNDSIRKEWARLFAGWPGLITDGEAAAGERDDTAVDATLHLEVSDRLPAPPSVPPIFIDNEDDTLSGPVGALSVYPTGKNEVLLHFRDAAAVYIPLDGQATHLSGRVTRQAFEYGRLEDITFTSLAPLLRHRGYFLIHAFAAVYDGRAILITGPSGSGKTTTGLRLVTAGWGFLSNDIVLLKRQDGVVYAFPMPGHINVRPGSIPLLPWLNPPDQAGWQLGEGEVRRPLKKEITHWAKPSPIAAIYFPKIEDCSQNLAHPLPQGICLAHLMEQSADRWDIVTLPNHINVLQQLSRQAPGYTLQLSRDLSQLPELLAGILVS